jgi:hypothetical protein
MTHTTTTTHRLRLNARCRAAALSRVDAWFVNKKNTTTMKNTKTTWLISVPLERHGV